MNNPNMLKNSYDDKSRMKAAQNNFVGNLGNHLLASCGSEHAYFLSRTKRLVPLAYFTGFHPLTWSFADNAGLRNKQVNASISHKCRNWVVTFFFNKVVHKWLLAVILQQVSKEDHKRGLNKHCRVCAKSMHWFKCKRRCSDYRDLLIQAYSIDCVNDDPEVHPAQFCPPCFQRAGRISDAKAKGAMYESSVTFVGQAILETAVTCVKC